jgi:hypothetical protein
MLFRGDGSRVTLSYDHGNLARDQFVDELRQAIELSMRRAPLKSEVLPGDKPVPCEAANEL